MTDRPASIEPVPRLPAEPRSEGRPAGLARDLGAVRRSREGGVPLAEIEACVDARRERFVKLRRRIHATPEVSGEERETTALVADTLRELGWEPQVGDGGIGVIADQPGSPGAGEPRIALRSELDALPVNDDKQVPYASTRPGVCHACGHDVHTVINLAVAAVLSDLRGAAMAGPRRHGLRLIFQPAEETSTGAREMIRQGALNGVEAILALHVDPSLVAGQIGVRAGPLTSATKSFRAIVRGRGGHSARPHEANDPIPAALALVSQFYQLGPRSMDNRYPLALTVTSVQAGGSFNSIPDLATVLGTLRAARLVDMESVQRRMEAIVRGAREATGCDIEFDFIHSCPATDNDPSVIEVIAGAALDVLGPAAVVPLDVASLGGEDFAFYQELIPGAMFRLGAAPADARERRPLHSTRFDINEDAIAIGTKVLAVAALRMAAGASTLEP